MKIYGYSSSNTTGVFVGCGILFASMAVLLTVIFGIFYGEIHWANYELITIWDKHVEFWKLAVSMILLTLVAPVTWTALVLGQIYIWFIM